MGVRVPQLPPLALTILSLNLIAKYMDRHFKMGARAQKPNVHFLTSCHPLSFKKISKNYFAKFDFPYYNRHDLKIV
jgi:hypothetical protein